MRFAAFGRTRMFLAAVERCIAAGHELVLLGTADPAREYGAQPADYSALAKRAGCRFFEKKDTGDDDFAALAAECSATIAISMNWTALVPGSVRTAFPHGVLNAHPGDLPRYRGNACPNWAILNGENEVVLTIHEMSEGLDEGPVYAKDRFELTPSTYVGDIYDWLHEAVPAAFESVLAAIDGAGLEPVPQPTEPSWSLRVYPRLPRDGLIDWTKPAEDLARLVRASAEPFEGAFTYLDGNPVRVWRARPQPLSEPSLGAAGQVTRLWPDTGEVGVLSGDGQLLLAEIEVGGIRRRASELVRSARARFGLDLPAELERLRARLDDAGL